MERSRTGRLRRTSVVAFATLALLGFLPGSARAYNTVNDHRLTYGVHNQYYWLDSSAAANNHDAVVGGVGLWNATSTTPVWYINTSTRSQSRLDFYRRTTQSFRYCATTTMWVDTTQVSPYAQNWWWAKVSIDPDLKDPDKCGSATHRRSMIAHEEGHAMGIDHNQNSSTLMYEYISETAVSGPRKDDIDAITFLY